MTHFLSHFHDSCVLIQHIPNRSMTFSWSHDMSWVQSPTQIVLANNFRWLIFMTHHSIHFSSFIFCYLYLTVLRPFIKLAPLSKSKNLNILENRYDVMTLLGMEGFKRSFEECKSQKQSGPNRSERGIRTGHFGPGTSIDNLRDPHDKKLKIRFINRNKGKKNEGKRKILM